MTNKQFNLLVAFTLLFVTTIFAQRPNYSIQNSIGLNGGITQFDIITDNFETTKQNGWTAGLTAIVNVEHKWYDVSYGIQFSDNNVGIAGRTSNLNGENVMLDYKLSAVQLGILMHAKLLKQNLTIDFGPIIQANGNLELKDKDTQENYFISGFDNLLADDIKDISKFNINGAIGATAGFKHFKLRAQYQYGFTNLFGKLNKQELDTSGFTTEKFKGNQSQVLLTALILF